MRGQSPRPSLHKSDNSLSRRNSNSSTANKNNEDDKKYRFIRSLSGRSSSIRGEEKPKYISPSKFHMPHIIHNISPSVLLNNMASSGKNNERCKSNDTSNNTGRMRRTRGRSSTPKREEKHSSQSKNNNSQRSASFSNKIRRSVSSSGGGGRNHSSNNNNSNSKGRRSLSFSSGDRSSSNKQRRSRSASISQSQQTNDNRRITKATRSISNRRSTSRGAKKQSLLQRASSLDQRGDDTTNNRRKRRPRGKSMPARLFHSMSHLGGWSSGTTDRNNATTNDDEIREEHLEASLLPELEREMKRLSSRSRERNKHTSTTGNTNNAATRSSSSISKNEWGKKPREQHTRNRSDNNQDQIRDLAAEVATIMSSAARISGASSLSNNERLVNPPPPRPPPPPPPPFQDNNTGSNYNRSKSLPKHFQRYTLLDVMVEMEKEIEIPNNNMRKKYSDGSGGGESGCGSRNTESDSVISPIASMDSSWRYKEDIMLMKSMASLKGVTGGDRGRGGRGGVPSMRKMRSGGSGSYVPMKSHGIKTRHYQQPPPPSQQQQTIPIRPPTTALSPAVAPRAVVGDIDGDDEEDDRIISPRRSKSVPSQVEEDEDEEESSLVTTENDDTNASSNNYYSEENDDYKSTASKDFTFGCRPEPISSVYGSSAIESPEVSTKQPVVVDAAATKKKKRERSRDSHSSMSAGSDGSGSSGGEGDSLIGYASVASDEKVGSIAPPAHSSVRLKKPGAIAIGGSPSCDHSGSNAHSMGTLSRMHHDLQRKMSELQVNLDEHGRPVHELDLASMDSSTGLVSDLTLPTVLLKAPPPASRIRAMKPKPLTTRRTKKGTIELQGDIDAMKSLAVSELSMASPVQSAFPKSERKRMSTYKKANNTSAAVAAPPPPRRSSAAAPLPRRNTHPKPEITPIVESSEEYFDSYTKRSSLGSSLQSKQSAGTNKSSSGTTSQMPMKPASGAGHRHAPPPPKHRPAGTKIDIGEVAQQLRTMQGQGAAAASSVGSSGRSGNRQCKPKGGGSISSINSGSLKHSSVEGMLWSDKFGKSGRYSGDVNADYVPHGLGAMNYDFGLAMEGRWVDGTFLSNDLDEFAV